MQSNRLTLIVTTIQRPEAAKRFLDSVRGCLPELPIILSEQADEHQLVEFCAERGIRHLALEFDSGLGHARNAMIDLVETDFFILTDDDYLFPERPDFDFCTRFLDARREFVCVLGLICDQHPSGDGYVYRAHDRIKNMCRDDTGGALVLIPRTFMPPPDIVFEGEELQRCDFGPNWGVFRRSFFVDNDVRWDERFKIGGGEHFDFFLQMKFHPARPGIAYWPKLRCDHMRGAAESYAQLRWRLNWRDEFRAKWGLQYRYDVDQVHNLEVFGGDLPGFEKWQTPPRLPAVLKLEQQLQQSHDINEDLSRRIAALQERLANLERTP
jgi:hypothetical protein